MVHSMSLKNFQRLSKEAVPAFLILILSIAFSIFSGEFAFLRGWEALYLGVLRFFRMSLFLCLPLILLPFIFHHLGSLISRRKKAFILIKRKQKLEIRPLKHWLFRPFAGAVSPGQNKAQSRGNLFLFLQGSENIVKFKMASAPGNPGFVLGCD